MNARTLYLAIGEIDDDLILAADQPSARHKRPAYSRWIALAACLLLAVAGLLFSHQGGDRVYFNSLTPPPPVTAKVQGEAELLNYQEAMDYYGLALPDTLGGLPRQERAVFALYRQTDGGVSWDENRVEYGQDGQRLTLSLSKAVLPYPESGQNGTLSTLQGTPVLLSSVGDAHWAQLELNGTTLRLLSQGLSQTEFLDAVRALLPA